jgi:S-DNA-T family DNA segregation ATPase FtsK/SpoIIIE
MLAVTMLLITNISLKSLWVDLKNTWFSLIQNVKKLFKAILSLIQAILKVSARSKKVMKRSKAKKSVLTSASTAEVSNSDEDDKMDREEVDNESPIMVGTNVDNDPSGNSDSGERLQSSLQQQETVFKPESTNPEILFSCDGDEIEDLKGYHLPDLKLLEEAEPKRENGPRIEPADYSTLLEETLLSFGIEAKVVHVERGPSVTRYELQPAKGVKVSKIVALSDDLALALAAMSLRIEAPIPGKSAIGIEIPNSSVAVVYFKDMAASTLFQESPLKMTLALGRDITGQPIFTELKRMPHLLIAGATGSGKTVCINTLIASILLKATPLEVQFVMIDPKRVELTIYDGIPHLIQEVVTDPKQAAKVLLDVLAIMDERYNTFKEARVRNLEEYNKANPESPLPYIIVLIDELADLMMLAAAQVEASIARLTALARAAGIHLIVATQRPSVDVITGIIKANIPSRVAFAVSSIADSRTILDTGGAEKLLGRGDMLFAPIDAMKPVRLQGALVSLKEIEALVSFWSQQPSPENLVQLPQNSDRDLEVESTEDEDDLYQEAKEIILRTGQASVSTLQRKLKIGYARAGRLMDVMEKNGVVGPADGSKPRKILVANPYH